MKKWQKLQVVSAFLVFLVTFNGAGHLSLAQDATSDGSKTVNVSSEPDATNTGDNLFDLQAAKRFGFLNLVKEELGMAQQDYANIRKNTEGTQEKLDDIKNQTFTLESQLKSLDEQMKNSLDIVQNILYQITEKENSLTVLKNDIEEKKSEIEKEKQIFLEYLKILYEQEGQVLDTSSDEEIVNVTKLLLLNKPIDNILQEKHYFDILTQTGQKIYERLDTLVKAQQEDRTKTEDTRNRLEMLYRQLEDERAQLAIQRTAKAKLLEETKGQQQVYEDLLEESKRQQAETLLDIEALRNNLGFIQKKVNELGGQFNPQNFKNALDPATTSLYEYLQQNNDENDIVLTWPVSPSSGISAYFHDSGYQHVFGVTHQAIDIRTKQGTPIHAPADGIVFKTKDNGYGYSYIILAHQGGFMTVYGHVSEIQVKEGDKIQRGRVIGLSGATPGTKGAGIMTTGPHLHFEVLKGGKHVDPLDYLPLTYLPFDSLPAKYMSRVTGEQNKVRRSTDENVQPADIVQSVEMNGMAETSSDE